MDRGANQNGYATGGASADVRERQRRQQATAIEVAAGKENIPGGTNVVAESQGGVPQTPATPAGEQFSAWLRAFNSADRQELERVRKRFKNPSEQEVEGVLGFRKMTGGFELRKIEESTPTRLCGLLQERNSDQFARFVMVVEPNSPHMITTWDLNAVATPPEFAVARMSEAQAVEATKARIDELVKREQFSGAVLVTKNGKPILGGAYGMAGSRKEGRKCAGHQIQDRLDEQNVHGDFSSAACASGQDHAQRAFRKIHRGLPQEGSRVEGQHRTTADAYRRHRGHLWSAVR
jgi:hypothetical protein